MPDLTAKPLDDGSLELYLDGVAVAVLIVDRDERHLNGSAQDLSDSYRRLALVARAYTVDRDDDDLGLGSHILDVSIAGSTAVRFTVYPDDGDFASDDEGAVSETVAIEKGWFS